MMARAKDVVQDLRKLPRCVFCGGRSADAVWIGKRIVGVCLQCGIEIMPRLIADAIGNRMNAQRDDPEDLTERHWQVIRANFSEAVHHNVCKLLREWQETNAGGIS